MVNVAEKSILMLLEDLMWNSGGKKICALPDKKNKYSNSCVVRKQNSERNKKP
jgi:hypothetical protein